jgi:hypothetical protein
MRDVREAVPVCDSYPEQTWAQTAVKPGNSLTLDNLEKVLSYALSTRVSTRHRPVFLHLKL